MDSLRADRYYQTYLYTMTLFLRRLRKGLRSIQYISIFHKRSIQLITLGYLARCGMRALVGRFFVGLVLTLLTEPSLFELVVPSLTILNWCTPGLEFGAITFLPLY